LSKALSSKGYDVDDFVTFTADKGGKITLYVFKRGS
jgi:hypothetical protein